MVSHERADAGQIQYPLLEAWTRPTEAPGREHEESRGGQSRHDHADGTDPYPLVVAALGGPVGAVGLADRMWAEQVLALRAVLPDTTTFACFLFGDPVRADHKQQQSVTRSAFSGFQRSSTWAADDEGPA